MSSQPYSLSFLKELIRFGPRGISSKISRERIGTEVAKMLQGANPERAIELLTKYKLHHCIIRFNDDEPARMHPRGVRYNFCLTFTMSSNVERR
jgi:tRNA nucleotidyltransferase/poly(A) polymerase